MTELESIGKLREYVDNYPKGIGTLTAEQVMAIAGRHQPDYCSDTHVCFDWQAIADELNARAERTCENTHENRWFKCSACGFGFTDLYANDADEQPRYCMNCGAKVVDA